MNYRQILAESEYMRNCFLDGGNKCTYTNRNHKTCKEMIFYYEKTKQRGGIISPECKNQN